MCQGPRELRRAAGLAQLQEEVLVVRPESGGDGPVGGAGRQAALKGKGHWEDCPLQTYMGDYCQRGTLRQHLFSDIANNRIHGEAIF